MTPVPSAIAPYIELRLAADRCSRELLGWLSSLGSSATPQQQGACADAIRSARVAVADAERACALYEPARCELLEAARGQV